jgi:NADPH-dependent 2,4-dienoyl-CoA reductase/sulfur reductase-like enzyme
MSRRYVIVGSGPAGISAAETIRRLDAPGEIVLVSEDEHGHYSRPGLAYLLTGEVPEKQLCPWRDADFDRLRLTRLRARALRLDAAGHRLELEGHGPLPYDRLLIATGSLAVKLDVPGTDLDGVAKLDDLADARRILAHCRRGRTAVVVGGGITALELVEGLRARQVRTHYLLRGARYWGSVLDEEESRIVEQHLQDQGVLIHYQSEVGQILGRRGRVSGVDVATRGGPAAGQTIPCDLVLYAIGVRPRLGLAQTAGLKAERGILTDDMLQTSEADVFAAGDVAQVFDPFSGRAVLDTLWSVAVAQGRAAGQNMAGQSVPYRKSVPLNVTRLAWLTTTIIGTVGSGLDRDVIGIARGDSETWRQSPNAVTVQTSGDGDHLRLVIGERTLLGAVIMGDQALTMPLRDLIAQQADISSIRDSLTELGLPEHQTGKPGDVIRQFWREWGPAHAPQP